MEASGITTELTRAQTSNCSNHQHNNANPPKLCNGAGMRLHLPIDLTLRGCDTCPACNSHNCELGLWPRQTEYRHYCNDCAYAWTTRTTLPIK